MGARVRGGAGVTVVLPPFGRYQRLMRIQRHVEAMPAALRGAVMALGNFDGVHRGHRSVIARARALADDLGAPAGAVTFEPHPRSFFQTGTAPFRLTPLRSKARLFAAMGLDVMVVLGFGPAMAGRLAQDFVVSCLVDGLAVRHVVTGPGFAFGRGRRGNACVLARMAGMEGFGYTQVPAFAHLGRKVSSTEIRVLLRRGQVGEAAQLLGHLWEFEGRVQTGFGRGRKLGFPTANHALDGMLHPGPGIYAVRAGIVAGGATLWHDAAAYIGTRPTFGGESVALETHLFDFAGDLYGRRLRIAFVARVRKDMAFRDAATLARRMGEDCQRARDLLSGLHGRSPSRCGELPQA